MWSGMVWYGMIYDEWDEDKKLGVGVSKWVSDSFIRHDMYLKLEG